MVCAGVSLPLKNTSVDSLAELRAEGHAGSWGSDSLQTGGESTKDTDDSKVTGSLWNFQSKVNFWGALSKNPSFKVVLMLAHLSLLCSLV